MKRNVRTGAISALVSLRILGEISSGPLDFFPLILLNNLMTPLHVTEMVGISGKGEFGSDTSLVSSSVNTEQKYLFRHSALS